MKVKNCFRLNSWLKLRILSKKQTNGRYPPKKNSYTTPYGSNQPDSKSTTNAYKSPRTVRRTRASHEENGHILPQRRALH